MSATKVVILGGGFAGINAAKALGHSKLDVWVIDKTNTTSSSLCYIR